MKNIKLKDAWLVKNNSVEKGKGFESKFNTNTQVYDEIFFVSSKNVITTSNWKCKIFFDLRAANIYLQDEKRSSIKYAKEQIAYYEKELDKFNK